MAKHLSEKDIKKREMILTGNMWYVVCCIAGPLALHQWIQQCFKLFDSMIAANISPMSVSAISYLSQVSNTMTSVGTGIAIGSCIKISEAYGAGDFELTNKRVNTLFKVCTVVAICVAIMIPFSSSLLRILNAPEDFITEGAIYFSIILIDTILSIFNTAYIALERVRGNSMRILKLNFLAVIIKISLSSFFVFVLNQGVAMIAVATVVSDFVIFTALIKNLCIKPESDIFSISSFNLKCEKKILDPLMHISFPVVAEKLSFQVGRLAVSSMAAKYGSLVVGALGVSNNIGGITITIQGGFRDAGSSIISQNIGGNNNFRAIDAFVKIVIINLIIGIIGVYIACTNIEFIVSFFDVGDPEFSKLIQEIYLWESIGAVFLGLYSAEIALLYGYGYTKITLALNFARLFVFRVPVLWFLQNFTDIGSGSVGIVIGISNMAVGTIGFIICLFIIKKIKREEALKILQENDV